MTERSPIDGRYWFPLGTRNAYHTPDPGTLIAFDHQAWLIISVRDVPDDRLDDHDRSAILHNKRPHAVRVRPVRLASHADPVTARSQDRHLAGHRIRSWYVYPDPEHYPVCACCSEPMPCRAETGRRLAERSIETMSRYEQPGVCPACGEVVTARQRSQTFTENLRIPAGPPVTFHLRGRCVGDADRYEREWAAAAPGRHRTLSCAGDLTNHNDGTYECTAGPACPSSQVAHRSHSMCSCPPCHTGPWTWGRGCEPHPSAQLRDLP